jgi:hypothetical protein
MNNLPNVLPSKIAWSIGYLKIVFILVKYELIEFKSHIIAIQSPQNLSKMTSKNWLNKLDCFVATFATVPWLALWCHRIWRVFDPMKFVWNHLHGIRWVLNSMSLCLMYIFVLQKFTLMLIAEKLLVLHNFDYSVVALNKTCFPPSDQELLPER